jgi:hypothetical protein
MGLSFSTKPDRLFECGLMNEKKIDPEQALFDLPLPGTIDFIPLTRFSMKIFQFKDTLLIT